MYKIAQVVRFAPGIGLDEGRQRWTGPHAELAARIPGVQRYVQNYAWAALHLVGMDPDRRPAFDGYACVWFADRASFTVAVASAEWSAMADDAATLFDPDLWPAMGAAVEERLIVDGPTADLKVMWFGRFPPDVRADSGRSRDASRYWTETHGRRHGVGVPGIGRYLQNHVVERLERGVDPGFDGFSEMWFEDEAAYRVMNGSSEWAEMNDDAATLFDRDWIVGGWSAALEEHVVVG